jgi:hypothetical protein
MKSNTLIMRIEEKQLKIGDIVIPDSPTVAEKRGAGVIVSIEDFEPFVGKNPVYKVVYFKDQDWAHFNGWQLRKASANEEE